MSNRPQLPSPTDVDLLDSLLLGYALPSEALWRYCEYLALQQVDFQRPILELGCGNGQFTSLVVGRVERAIDLDPRAVTRAKDRGHYDEVEVMDARDLDPRSGPFGTVLANCVLEHIPQIGEVLSKVGSVLKPGGQLVATVPLVAMNKYLLFSSEKWRNWRQRTLVHENLFDELAWIALLKSAGFEHVDVRPYLWGGTCRLWDAFDGPGCVGRGRIRVGLVGRRSFDLLPSVFRRSVRRQLAQWLMRRLPTLQGQGEPCAALLIAAWPQGSDVPRD